MATNQKQARGGNHEQHVEAGKKGGQAKGAHEAHQGGVTPSADEQAKHQKHVEAGKKGGEAIKKEAGKK